MAKKNRRAKRSEGTKRRRERGFITILSIVVIVALLGVMVIMVASQFVKDVPFLEWPRLTVARLLAPIQKTFATTTDGLVGYLRSMKRQSNLEYEYNKAIEELNEKTDQLMLMDELKRKLAAFEDLDDERSRNLGLDGVKANIIARDASNYGFSLTIDVGKQQGIEEYMAVVVPGALVGMTYDVQQNTSRVKCLIDSNFKISALIESSRDEGTVQGTLAFDGKKACRMYYAQYTALPRPGDKVVTSGYGFEFIKGIPIGSVRESTRGVDDNRPYIVIEPFADFDHIEYVIVYRYRPTHPEKSERRDSAEELPLVTLPPAEPVPTFIGQPPPPETPMPEPGALLPTATPAPSPDPTPVPSPEPIGPPNIGYNQAPVTTGEPPEATADPDVTPSPSPVPSPTFSIDQVTVEEDN